MATTLKWGIIGTGNIAKTFARGLKASKTGTLVAVGSRSAQTALDFGKQFGIPPEKCYSTYSELIRDPDIDIVYISTPHPQHCDIAVEAASEGKKHLLVEKPIAMNEAQVRRIIEAAKQNDVFLMEAYMYRCHPQTIMLADLVRNGAVGQVKLIRGNFSFDGRPLGPSSRLWRNELGGGAILDIGGYPMSMSRLIAGAASQKSKPLEPTEIKAVGHVQPDTKVDEWAIASLAFENGVTAQLFTAIFADSDCSVQIIGSKGTLRVPNLWRPDLAFMGPIQIELTEYGKDTQTIPVALDETDIFAIEADAVAEAITEGRKECKYMTWNDTLGQVRAMDKWRKEIGLTYKEDF